MDTEKCAALLKVLELGSLSAAAQALGYTPSGVSRMMVSAHFFGDVLAGAVFGVAVGLAIGCLFRWGVAKAKL